MSFLPPDTEEVLLQFANHALWSDMWSWMSFAFGIDDFAVGMVPPLCRRGSDNMPRTSLRRSGCSAYTNGFSRRLQPVPAPTTGPDCRSRRNYGSPGQSNDPGSQGHKIMAFDLAGMNRQRHRFLRDKCQMTDPSTDPAVRNRQSN